MKVIDVRKDRLLTKLKENRENHRKTFEEALDGWQKKVIDELQKAVRDARAGRKYTTTFYLPQPQDHTAEYDAIIEQVEWEEDETISLDPISFNQFVRDDWGWKTDFLNNTMVYMNYKK